MPCNLPKGFIPEGDIGEVVKYSGEITVEEGSDPAWLGLDLSFIERIDQELIGNTNKAEGQSSD